MNETSYLDNSQRQLLGKPIKLKKSTEPSNIIWENLRIKNWRYYIKVVLYFFLIGMILVAAFGCVVYIKKYSIQLLSRYPEIDCD
jgi:hypothetical protein